MNNICIKLQEIKSKIPEKVKLIAVSKTKPIEDILSAYNCNHKHFGENKVQELVAKYEALPKDIFWHMIGHLQRNKVKYIAPFVYLIHGVDNIKLLKEINKQATKNQRKIQVLLQIKIASEETKFGMNEGVLKEIAELYQNKEFSQVAIKGMMGMATFTDNREQIASEFSYLHQLYQRYRQVFPEFEFLSMGMSGDYKIAIKNGSNMIRLGSVIFGDRNI
jgi:pyridoxal phosphate enzyme (YggS family)